MADDSKRGIAHGVMSLKNPRLFLVSEGGNACREIAVYEAQIAYQCGVAMSALGAATDQLATQVAEAVEAMNSWNWTSKDRPRRPLPCPDCGATAASYQRAPSDAKEWECDRCGADVLFLPSPKKALQAALPSPKKALQAAPATRKTSGLRRAIALGGVPTKDRG